MYSLVSTELLVSRYQLQDSNKFTLKLIFTLFFVYLSFSGISQDTTIRIQSAINFPLKIKFSKLETLTNSALDGLLFKDSLYTDNENDQFKCTVWKDGNIKISHVKNNVLKIDVPLKVWAEKGLGTLGIYNYQSTDFKLMMSFQMVYTITPDWKLKTKTFSNSYTWVQKPVLEIVKIKIPLTNLVEKSLNEKQAYYASNIDYQMDKFIDLKKDVLTVWNKLKTPEKVSEQYKTWLRFTPINIECAPFTQDKIAIHSTIKLNIISETFMGMNPPINQDTNDIPRMITANLRPTNFELYTTAHIPCNEATLVSKNKFIGQKYQFNNGKYEVEIKDIAISTLDNKLVLDVDMIGSYNGKMLIQGIPYYNDTTKLVKLKNVEINLKTRNLLIKLYDWLFNGKIEQLFESKFEIPTQENIAYSKKCTNSALNQVKNGMKFSGQISEMKPLDIKLYTDKICLIILSNGNLKVEY